MFSRQVLGQVFLCIVRHNLPIVDNDHTVTGGLHFGQHMRGKDDSMFFAQAADQVPDFNDLLGAVSYTHLDVYKRQVHEVGRS